jgi:rhamnose transport system ATP-binding protein
VDWRARRARAAEVLARIGADLDPDRPIETLSAPEQQLVEIAKAVGVEARIVLMDEPTASLGGREVDRLFAVIGRLREAGAGILYISHRIEEIRRVADRVTIIRDGATVAAGLPAATASDEIIRLMVGRDLERAAHRSPTPAGEVVLEVRGLSSRAAGVRDISLTVRRGEIVGVAGLVGAGRTELAETLFGLRPADEGVIRLCGAAVSLQSPSHAIEAGIAYVPEDRRRHGVVSAMSVASNVTLASLGQVSRSGLVDRGAEAEVARSYVERLRILTPSLVSPVGSLSGGNQQKVALARWLATRPTLLILDEPTQGVDVGSKAEIHGLMRELADEGLAILMMSSDLPEVLHLSDRIVVMHRGRVSGTLDRSEATEATVLGLALDRGGLLTGSGA